MSDANWFYTSKDEEFGPVDSGRLRELAREGTITREDEVWREGLNDWISATRVDGLFDSSPTAPPVVRTTPPPHTPARQQSTPTPVPSTSESSASTPFPRMVDRYLRRMSPSKLVLFAGLMIVLFAKGSDSVSGRYVDRLGALETLSQSSFDDQWLVQREGFEQELVEISGRDPVEEGDAKRREEIHKELKEIANKRADALPAFERKSRAQKRATRDAVANQQASRYWSGLAFVFGTLLLSCGLLVVGFTGSGSERIICLIMLAIITFSIFVGGIAWIPNLTV